MPADWIRGWIPVRVKKPRHSWWTFGGGDELVNEALKPFKAHAILCGNSGTQMGGWFRKEIKRVDDLKGLKFRIAGMGVPS